MKKVCPVCKAEYGGGEVFCPVDAARLVTPSQMQGDPAKDDPGRFFLYFTGRSFPNRGFAGWLTWKYA